MVVVVVVVVVAVAVAVVVVVATQEILKILQEREMLHNWLEMVYFVSTGLAMVAPMLDFGFVLETVAAEVAVVAAFVVNPYPTWLWEQLVSNHFLF